MKLKAVAHGETNEHLGYAHWCQGCNEAHIFYTRPGTPQWTFVNNDMEKPTFVASMKIFRPAMPSHPNPERRAERTLCHYILTDGVINYLADSTGHDLRGHHPLQDIPPDYHV